MVDYREILRLHNLGYSQRVITSSVHSSRSTVKEVIDLANFCQRSNRLSQCAEDRVASGCKCY